MMTVGEQGCSCCPLLVLNAMDHFNQSVPLRVRLADSCWRRLKQRAALRKSAPGPYADMIFRYLLQERIAVHPTATMDDPEEEIYFDLQVASATKQQLTAQSVGERWNLATFSGLLLAAFLSRYDRDPRDLAMIHYLTSRLDATGLLTEQDLRKGIGHCEYNPELRLPAGYFARWLHSRLQSVVGAFERDGVTVKLTLQAVRDIVEDPAKGVQEG